MSVSAISNHTAASAAAAIDYGEPADLAALGAGNKSRATTPADVKKAAEQFEAIIMRQLLAPSIEPIMSGGMGGNGASGTSGGGVYAQMLTEVLADSLSKAGGLGLGKMLQKEFTARTEPVTSAPLSSKALLKPLTSSTESP
ncbi:MAG: rod-binding protein [Nibricoccus sp.]